jgi:hypothetical protein
MLWHFMMMSRHAADSGLWRPGPWRGLQMHSTRIRVSDCVVDVPDFQFARLDSVHKAER